MLGLEPPIRENFDKVIGWKGIEEWHAKGEVLLLTDLIFFENKLLVVKDLLSVPIFNNNPESFRSSVEPIVPLELLVSLHFELNSHSAPSDWLHES